MQLVSVTKASMTWTAKEVIRQGYAQDMLYHFRNTANKDLREEQWAWKPFVEQESYKDCTIPTKFRHEFCGATTARRIRE